MLSVEYNEKKPLRRVVTVNNFLRRDVNTLQDYHRTSKGVVEQYFARINILNRRQPIEMPCGVKQHDTLYST